MLNQVLRVNKRKCALCEKVMDVMQTVADKRAHSDMTKTVQRRPKNSPIMDPIRLPTENVRNGNPLR